MKPKNKIQKHHLYGNYNQEISDYNGWLLEIPTDERVVVISVRCQRPNLCVESTYSNNIYFEPHITPRTTEIYFELIQNVTDEFKEIIRHFGGTERMGRVMGYKKNMTLRRYTHGTPSETYHLLGCVISEVRLSNLDGDDSMGYSFTLMCDYFTFIT